MRVLRSGVVSGLIAAVMVSGAASIAAADEDPPVASGADDSSATHQGSEDSVRPTLSFRHTIKGWTGSNVPVTRERSASFTFSTTDPTAELLCRIDPPISYLEKESRGPDGTVRTLRFATPTGPFVACSSPQALADLSEGLHSVAVQAVDPAGNITSQEIRWRVDYNYLPPDTQPPSLAFSEPVKLDRDTYEVAFRVSEEASVTCRIQGGGVRERRIGSDGSRFAIDTGYTTNFVLQPCVSPFSWTDVPEGRAMITIEATDPSGNKGNSGRGWLVDSTPPEVILSQSPGEVSNPNPAFRFSSSESDPGQVFECSLDDRGWAPCASPVELRGLADGRHSFSIKATDPAGNTGEPRTFEWLVDAEAPVARIVSGPPSIAASAEATLVAEITGESAVLECSVDDRPWAACDSEVTIAGLAEGPHSFMVRAVDGVGNAGPVDSLKWVVDSSGPAVSLFTRPENPSASSVARFSWTSEPGARFECRIDRQAWSECVSPKAVSGLQDGRYIFEVRGIDQVGNFGLVSTHSWTVEVPQPPTLPTDPGPAPSASIVSGPRDRTSSRSATFVINHSEGSALSCRSSQPPLPQAAAWQPCVSPVTVNGFRDGWNFFEVRASDQAGRVSTPGTWSWMVDTNPPVVLMAANPLVSTTTTLASFSFRANEREATFRCRLDSGAWSGCASPVEHSGLEAGEHTFEVIALDFSGNRSKILRYTWEVVLPVADFEIFGESDPVSVVEPEQQAGVEPRPEPEPGVAQEPAGEPQPEEEPQSEVDPTLERESRIGIELIAVSSEPESFDPPRVRSAPLRTTSQRPLFRLSASAPGTENFCSIDRGLAVRCGSVWRPARKLSGGWHTFRVQGRASDGRLTPATTRLFRVAVSR